MTESSAGRSATAALMPIFELIREEMAAVDAELDGIYQSDYPRIRELLGYLAGYRGKRIRPALVFLAGKSCGRLTEDHRRLGIILETLHTATLIHDDIIDEADVRRKIESVNHRFGNERAVLLGDFLFAESFQVAVQFENLDMRLEVSKLCRDLCIGEILEISHRFDLDLTEEQYLDIIHKKTGLLFEVGCGLAARLAGATPERVQALADFARYLGMAFQIVDDCLDLVGEETSMGKSLGNDVTHGMTTLPIIEFFRTASPEVRGEFRKVFHSPASIERDRAIQRFIQGSDAVRYAYRMAEKWTGTAKECLDVLEDSPYRSALGEILQFVVRRIC